MPKHFKKKTYKKSKRYTKSKRSYKKKFRSSNNMTMVKGIDYDKGVNIKF